jgi:hypothetical protein
MPSDVPGLRTHAAAAATASRRHFPTGQPLCGPRMMPAAKASPAPAPLRTCSRGSRTEPCRQVRPPGGRSDAAGREVHHGEDRHATLDKANGHRLQRRPVHGPVGGGNRCINAGQMDIAAGQGHCSAVA